MTLLDITNLHVSYHGARGAIPAVRGIDLTVDAGETVGLAGESGCGKSTVAHALLRLLPKSVEVTGEVLLNGEDVLTMKWGRLRAVRWAGASIVFQGAMHSLNAVRRVGDQIAEPILLHERVSDEEANRRTMELLGQVGLPAWRAQSYPHELSGGQRQRVMIAMALACNPELIIADEATTALDVMVQAQVLSLISRLVAELDVGMIMISHDLSVLSENCQQVAVMYAGKIVETAPAHQLFTSPLHPYSDALASAFPVVGDASARLRPRGLGGDPPRPDDVPPGCSFHPRCPVAISECSVTEPQLLGIEGEDPGRVSACLVAQAGEPIRPLQVRS